MKQESHFVYYVEAAGREGDFFYPVAAYSPVLRTRQLAEKAAEQLLNDYELTRVC